MGQSRNVFEGGCDKVVQSFDRIFNVQSAEARRPQAQLHQRWQLKPSIATFMTWGVVCKVVKRLPMHTRVFSDLHHIKPAPVILSHDSTIHFHHSDTSKDPCALPLVDGQVSRCNVHIFLVLSSKYPIALQARCAYGEVSNTHFDEM